MTGDQRHLPCGTDLDELSRQVFEGAPASDPAHQESCAYCQEALRRLRALSEDLHGVASLQVAPPRGLLGAVMARVRSKPALVTVDVSDRGATRVSDAVIAEVARIAAASVPGVRHASVIATEEKPDGVVALRAHLVVAFGPALPDIAEAVKQAVARAVEEQVGASPRSVDVSVEDLI